MARPRVFISSTFYDLRHVRSDIERFIIELGYDPILHERGNVPYGKEEELQSYCYREISNCDILISILGSRFGSPSKTEEYSVSQMELKTALEMGKQVYVFIENVVYHEHNTYLKNKDNKSVVYSSVDDVRIFRFIDQGKALPNNNVITGFYSVEEICKFLKEQWAGLYQRMLYEQTKKIEVDILAEMKASARTLNEMVGYFSRERENTSDAIKHIVFANQPIFSQMAKLTGTPYRVYFTNFPEMKAWIEARLYKFEEEFTDDDDRYQVWLKDDPKSQSRMTMNMVIFDDDEKLKSYTPAEWDENYVRQTRTEKKSTRASTLADDLDDDIPF